MIYLRWKKYYMDKGVDFYKKTFNENDIPHIYVIGLFSLIEFTYFLLFSKFFGTRLVNADVYILGTILLIFNFGVYKLINTEKEAFSNSLFFYFYATLPLAFIIIRYFFF